MVAEHPAESVRPAEMRRHLLFAAGVAAGVLEVSAFLVPLWAGTHVRASPQSVGVLVALEILAALLAHPAAGRLADRGARGIPAAVGLALVAASMVVFAVAHSLVAAGFGAVLAGTGSVLFWVPVRAHIADLGGTPGAFGRLFAYQSRGELTGYLFAFALLAWTGYTGVFLCSAGAAAVAGVLLLVEKVPSGEVTTTQGPGRTRRLVPAATLVALTAVVQAGLGLLLLLHLQRHFDLAPSQIGLVLGPGFLVFVLASGSTHRLTDRLGRRNTLFLALSATAVMAVMLAFAGNTAVISAAWALTAACIAGAVPVEQAAVAAASGTNIGHGLSLYGIASLTGSFIGPAAFGLLYGFAGWRWACLVAAALAAGSLALVPWVIRSAARPVPSSLVDDRSEL